MSTGWEGFAVIQTEPAYAEHQSQKIVMNEKGRQRLLKALADKETRVKAYCHDGEGYDLLLVYGEAPIDAFYLQYALWAERAELSEAAREKAEEKKEGTNAQTKEG